MYRVHEPFREVSDLERLFRIVSHGARQATARMNRVDQDDVVQRTMLRVLEKWSDPVQRREILRNPPIGLLYKIAHDVAVDEYRREASRPAESYDAALEAGMPLPSAGESAEDVVLAHESVAELVLECQCLRADLACWRDDAAAERIVRGLLDDETYDAMADAVSAQCAGPKLSASTLRAHVGRKLAGYPLAQARLQRRKAPKAKASRGGTPSHRSRREQQRGNAVAAEGGGRPPGDPQRARPKLAFVDAPA